MERKPLTEVALITGAAGRIGRAVAERLASEGYALALHASARSAASAQALADATIAAGGAARVLVADLGDPEAVARLVPDAVATFGGLDLLVNNARIFEEDTAADFDAARFDRHLAINLRAAVQLATAFAQVAPDTRRSAVVNIVDRRIWPPQAPTFSYAASQVALWATTRNLARSLAPRVRVNAAGPSPDMAGKTVTLEEGADVAMIAEAIVYLARASSVTGQMIAVGIA